MDDALKALLARLEAATGADRELDAAIAIVLDGAESIVHGYIQSGPIEPLFTRSFNGEEDQLEAYTASIDAALALVERVLPASYIVMDNTSGPERMHWGAAIEPPQADDEWGRDHFYAFAPTPAFALLIALVQAKIAEAEASP